MSHNMTQRSRVAVLGAGLFATALVLVPAAGAHAAVTVVSPTYASSTQGPAGTYAAFNAPVSVTSLPTALTTTPLTLPEPTAASGVILDPATVGTVTMTSQQTIAEPGSTSTVRDSPIGTQFPNSIPENITVVSDFWLGNQPRGEWTYTFDFTNLGGGVLPAGSVLNTSDIDVCAARSESVQMTSESASPWLSFDFNRQITGLPATGRPPVVSFDDAAGTYSVTAATAPCGDVNMGNWFTTTRPISSLTVVMTNASANGSIFFGMRVPTVMPEPGISIVKTTNGQDVAAAPGPDIAAGAPVSWDYTVNNTGNVTLGNVAVTDDQVASVDIDCGDGTNILGQLAAGASATCTATGVATEGLYQNTAQASGVAITSAGDPIANIDPVTASDTSWYTGTVERALRVAKTVDRATAAVGETLIYTLEVTNVGVGTIENVLLADLVPNGLEIASVNGGGVLQGKEIKWNLGTLLAGERRTVTITAKVTAAAAGTDLENVADTSGDSPSGTPVDSTATAETACVDDSTRACALTAIAAVAAPPVNTALPSAPADSSGASGSTLAVTGSWDALPAACVAVILMFIGGLVVTRKLLQH